MRGSVRFVKRFNFIYRFISGNPVPFDPSDPTVSMNSGSRYGVSNECASRLVKSEMTKLAAAAMGIALLICVGSASQSATRAPQASAAESRAQVSTVSDGRTASTPPLTTAEIERPATRSSAPAARQVITSRGSTAPGKSFPAARPSPSPEAACGRLVLSPVQPDCALFDTH
jgi:hypothetical protein